MTDVNSTSPTTASSDADLRRGIELLYFGYRDFTSGPDEILIRHGLGRAHHRALYFIARQQGLIVSELLGYLRITKQSLARVLGDLQGRGLVQTQVVPNDRRQRSLRLTEAGMALELELYHTLCASMRHAYDAAGPDAVTGFWQVLGALIHPDERLPTLRQPGGAR